MNQIGKFKILRELGSGGFGAVYLGEDPDLGDKVAIKVFRIKDQALAREVTSATGDAGEILKERFLNEAKMLRQLEDSPHVVNVREFGRLEDDTPYFVMPYFPHSLVDLIGRDAFTKGKLTETQEDQHPRAIPIPKALDILEQILEGLATVHQLGLVHRDIKPANILLEQKGQLQNVVLCDFGIAKSPEGEHSKTGVGMGSANYVSPEQRESAKHVDARSDVFSVGVLAYRMLTGTVPNMTGSSSVKALLPSISAELNDLIMSAIHPEVDERPLNAKDFLKQLKALENTVTGGVDESEETGTQIGGKQAPVSEKLKPLYEQIKQAWLNDGEIDAQEREQFIGFAAVHDIDEKTLDSMIEEVYLQHKDQIKPLQNIMALVGQRISEQITKANRELKAHSVQILRNSAQAIGWDDATFDAMLKAKIAEYEKAQGWKPLKHVQKQQAQPTNKPAGTSSGEGNTVNRIVMGLVVLTLVVVGIWMFGTNKSPEPNEQTNAKINTSSQKHTQSEVDKQKAQEAQAALDASKPKFYSLTIQPEPSNATVKILNINPKYEDGIELEAGDYHISVSSPGYETTNEWLTLTERSLSKRIRLTKEEPIETKISPIVEDEIFGIKLVTIPAGSFMMGSSDGEANEKPIHKVSIQTFKMMAHEVTVGQFKAFVDATGHQSKGCLYYDSFLKTDDNKSWENPGYSQSDGYPVVCINWEDAQAYAKWLSQKTNKPYRLPSEAEWEYAARAGSNTRYSFGDNGDDLCHYGNVADQSVSPFGSIWNGGAKCDDGYWFSAPVGRYEANAFGLYDMYGNVSEWMQDCWNNSYRKAPSKGEAWTKGECDSRVLRGGSWDGRPESVRSASRNKNGTAAKFKSLGFRLVQGR